MQKYVAESEEIRKELKSIGHTSLVPTKLKPTLFQYQLFFEVTAVKFENILIVLLLLQFGQLNDFF